MRYKNLFFDLDDTLWDTCHNNRECLKELYADYHFDRHYASFEAFYDFYMPHNLDLWAKYRNGEVDRQTLIVERFLYVLRPLGIESRQAALDINRDFLERTATKSRLISGAADLLRYLRPSYRIFILSNGFREVQSRKLASAGIDSFFQRIILSEDARVQKPHKAIFDYALQNTNSRRSESIMIGDSWEADISGAYHAGIDQIWFNPQNEPSRDFIPTFTVQTLEAIKNNQENPLGHEKRTHEPCVPTFSPSNRITIRMNGHILLRFWRSNPFRRAAIAILAGIGGLGILGILRR